MKNKKRMLLGIVLIVALALAAQAFGGNWFSFGLQVNKSTGVATADVTWQGGAVTWQGGAVTW